MLGSCVREGVLCWGGEGVCVEKGVLCWGVVLGRGFCVGELC